MDATMARKKEPKTTNGHRPTGGRPRKPERTFVSLRLDNELVEAVDVIAEEEQRWERNSVINVLVREALIARGRLKAKESE